MAIYAAANTIQLVTPTRSLVYKVSAEDCIKHLLYKIVLLLCPLFEFCPNTAAEHVQDHVHA